MSVVAENIDTEMPAPLISRTALLPKVAGPDQPREGNPT